MNDLKCYNCPNAYYIDGKFIGCVNKDRSHMKIANDGEGITAMVTDRGICVYSVDILHCDLWRHTNEL